MISALRISVTLALFTSLAAIAADPGPKVKLPKSAPVAVYEVRRGDGMRYVTRLNGFSLEDLVTSQDRGDALRDFPSAIAATVVHPYYLRADNVVTAEANLDDSLVAKEDQGPWSFAAAITRFEVGPDSRATEAAPTVLAELQTESVTRGNTAKRKSKEARFAWKDPLPVWAWNTAPVIKNDNATRDALYAELTAFHAGLVSLHDEKTPAADKAKLRDRVKASTRDYVAACELYGKKDTFLDDLFAAATTLGLPGDEAVRAEAKKPKKRRPPELAPAHDEPRVTGPEDFAMDHLSLSPLPPKGELQLDVMADGRLARLVSGGSRSPIALHSNWPDGGWGAVGDEKVEAEVWFRKGKDGAWEVDAVVNGRTRHLSLLDDGLDGLLESSGLR
jgi:hypothetical protein